MTDENLLPGIDVPDGIARDAAEFLSQSTANPGHAAEGHNELVVWLSERMTRVSKENRDHHYKTIAEVYAVYAALNQTKSLRSAIVSAARAQGITFTRRKTILRFLVELHLSYTTDTDPKSVKQAAKNHSRDVKAIESLIRQGIPPSDVLRLSREPKQGLDYWVRMNSPAKKGQEEKQSKVDADQQELKTLRIDSDGVSEITSSKGKLEGIDRTLKTLEHLPNRIIWEKRIGKKKMMPLISVDLSSKFSNELKALFKKYRAID